MPVDDAAFGDGVDANDADDDGLICIVEWRESNILLEEAMTITIGSRTIIIF